MFEYTKLSLPDVKLRKEKVELGNLLSQLVGEYIPIFEKQQLIVELNIMNKDIWVWADIEKLVRVFDNLLSNTEKYSFSNSTVIVELKKKKVRHLFVLQIKQINLEAQELSKMFEKFYRVDKSRSSQIHGSELV